MTNWSRRMYALILTLILISSSPSRVLTLAEEGLPKSSARRQCGSNNLPLSVVRSAWVSIFPRNMEVIIYMRAMHHLSWPVNCCNKDHQKGENIVPRAFKSIYHEARALIEPRGMWLTGLWLAAITDGSRISLFSRRREQAGETLLLFSVPIKSSEVHSILSFIEQCRTVFF